MSAAPRTTVSVDTIHGVPTQVVHCGEKDCPELVLVVPGNPGVARFYVPLAEALCLRGQGRWQVAVLGHAGHVPPLPLQPGSRHFSLREQIDHKLAFLASRPGVKTIHLLGHSIGCWMVLSLLDQLPQHRRGRAMLVCPTISRMAITPNGRRLSWVFRHGQGAVRGVVWSILHTPGHAWMLDRLLLQRTPAPQRAGMLQSMLELRPASVGHVLGMADEEMAVVDALPVDALRRHGPRLGLLYAPTDPWNLPDMPRNITQLQTGAEVVIGPASLRHSFVLFGCDEVTDFCVAQLSRE